MFELKQGVVYQTPSYVPTNVSARLLEPTLNTGSLTKYNPHHAQLASEKDDTRIIVQKTGNSKS